MFERLTKSKMSMGYDPKFAERETLELVDAIKDAFIAGYRRNTIAKLLCEEMDMKYQYAQALTGKVWKMVVKDSNDRTEGMKEKNLQRLEFLYSKAVEQNDMKNAINALDQINKLCQLYKEKIEVSGEEYVLDLIGEGNASN